MTKSTVESLSEVVVDLTEKASIRVLHVDDEAGFLKVAKQCLEMQGAFQVETALSVEEAMEKMKKKTFDVIVADYVMPGKDGLEFLKELRDNGNNIPFIMFTGKGREEVAIKALNLGADQYFNKIGSPETVYGELAHGVRQVVESKRAEEALSNSEEKYRSLFENARDVTLTYDLKGNVTSINKAAVEYGFKKDEIIGKNILKFVPKKYWPRLLKELVQNTQGKAIEGEIEINTPQGEKLAEYGSAPIIIDDKVVGVQTILRDITERKKILEELRSSEDRLKILFEFAPDAYYLNDLKGNFIDGNKAAEELTGYTREELIGKSFLKLKLLPRRQILKATTLLAKNALGKPTGPDEFILNRKDGTQVPVEIRTFPVKVKDQTVVLGIARHITERKKAEEALKESEEKYRNLFENARDIILTLDLKGNVTSINKAVARYGFKEEEIIGKNLRKFVPKKYWLRLLKNISNISQGKPARGEIEIITPKGKITTEYQSNPISRGKKVVGIQSTLRNITERKHFEERLSALNIYSRKLNTAECMKEIYTLTLDAMEKTLGFENAAFMVVDKDMLCVVDQRGFPEPHLYLKLPLNGTKGGITVMAARTGRSVLVPDTRKERAYVEVMPDIRSELDVLIKIGHKILGVLNVESKRLEAFDERDQKLLEILASHAATAMSNLEYAKNLELHAREIRESQKKFEGLFMGNPEAAVYLDSDFHILDFNPRFKELFGYSLNEIKGKHIDDVVVPKDKMEEAEMLDKKAGEGYVYHATVRKRKDGSLVSVSISAAPITVEDQLIGYVGVYKDISQLKRTEETLKETLEKVETMNEKLGVVGKLTRHDARNKLSTVTMNTFLAKQKLASNHEALEHLSEIESAVQQTERIFDFARIYEKLGMEELTYMNVEKSLKEAVMLFSDLHSIKVVNDCRDLTVLADSLLRQILYNLVDNSLKHGERVSQIRVYYEEVGKNQLKIVYEDDGVGIPKAEKEKIFKEGYGKGTGYGLYLIRKMCEVYGWTIQETGKQGEGAQFTITIPKINNNGKINYNLH